MAKHTDVFPQASTEYGDFYVNTGGKPQCGGEIQLDDNASLNEIFTKICKVLILIGALKVMPASDDGLKWEWQLEYLAQNAGICGTPVLLKEEGNKT